MAVAQDMEDRTEKDLKEIGGLSMSMTVLMEHSILQIKVLLIQNDFTFGAVVQGGILPLPPSPLKMFLLKELATMALQIWKHSLSILISSKPIILMDLSAPIRKRDSFI